MICALGWHRWNGGRCAACGKTRHCSAEKHYWRGERCAVCGSRRMGIARMVTLIDKIARKRFDKLHPEWIKELTDVGPIAIPFILREMRDLARSEADLISPSFLDLRRAIQDMGARGRDVLEAGKEANREASVAGAEAEKDSRKRVAGVIDEMLAKWAEAPDDVASTQGH